MEKVRELPYWAALKMNDEAIGFFCAKIHYGHTGDIFVCGIDSAYQHQGVGKILYHAVEEFCIHNNCKYIIVKTLSDMVDYEPYLQTRKFYESIGFDTLLTLTEMWDEDNPCLIMIKILVYYA